MVTEKDIIINIGIIAILVNIFVMLISPLFSIELFEILRSTSIALFGSGLILFDILQKLLDKNIFKNTDVAKLGTFFIVFWGAISTVFEEIPSIINDYLKDWGLFIVGMVLIVSVSVMDKYFISEGNSK